jgi:hypothetical protein
MDPANGQRKLAGTFELVSTMNRKARARANKVTMTENLRDRKMGQIEHSIGSHDALYFVLDVFEAS